jgi:hypothetical protein
VTIATRSAAATVPITMIRDEPGCLEFRNAQGVLVTIIPRHALKPAEIDDIVAALIALTASNPPAHRWDHKTALAEIRESAYATWHDGKHKNLCFGGSFDSLRTDMRRLAGRRLWTEHCP